MLEINHDRPIKVPCWYFPLAHGILSCGRPPGPWAPKPTQTCPPHSLSCRYCWRLWRWRAGRHCRMVPVPHGLNCCGPVYPHMGAQPTVHAPQSLVWKKVGGWCPLGLRLPYCLPSRCVCCCRARFPPFFGALCRRRPSCFWHPSAVVFTPLLASWCLWRQLGLVVSPCLLRPCLLTYGVPWLPCWRGCEFCRHLGCSCVPCGEFLSRC